jgi:hypothetical protein
MQKAEKSMGDIFSCMTKSSEGEENTTYLFKYNNDSKNNKNNNFNNNNFNFKK